MPSTALRHFEEDIERSRAIHTLATGHRSGTVRTARLQGDLLRSSWMFCVGAFDAYFCDAYADLLARMLRAKNRQHDLELPPAISNIDLPVGAIFAPPGSRDNWRWRHAARGLMEKDNVLSISKIQQLINPFLSKGNKLFKINVIDSLIKDCGAPQRLVGIQPAAYRRLTGKPLSRAREVAKKKIVERINDICQRRHDCIHNCDRPKQALQRLTVSHAEKAIDDIELLVKYCDSHIESEFNKCLRSIGANGVTRNDAGY